MTITTELILADLQTLEKALPPSRLALLKLVASNSEQAQHAIYIVGGFVRDLLLERPSFDFDFVVEGDALQVAQTLAQQYGGRVISHKRFSTAKWQIKNIRLSLLERMGIKDGKPTALPESLDFISARTEFYDHPTALPTVERSSIKLDLHRRDFTINTLALRLDGHHYGELYDYWGGMQDLERKQVRVLHSLSFVDDPTRLLRAVRFEQRFHFQIEKRTLQLMDEALELLHQLSGERIHHEFDLIFNDPDPVSIMQRLEELGLLHHIHPGLRWQAQNATFFSQVINYAQFSDWNLPDLIGNTTTRHALIYLTWLASLDGNAGQEVANRMRLPRQLQNTLAQLIKARHQMDKLSVLSPSQLTMELEKLPLYGVFALYTLTENPALKTSISLYATKWRFIFPGVDGNTLLARGIPPGPRYASILAGIRDAWLDGRISNADEEAKLLEYLLGACHD